MATRRLNINITGSSRDAERAFGNVETRAGAMKGKLGRIGKEAGRAMALGMAAGLAGGAWLAKDFADAASDMEETLSKSNTVFGDSAKNIEEWSKTAADNFGQSQQQALDAAGSFGNMFVQLGIGQEQAAAMSKAQTELASDFASFHNTSPEEAIEAMSAAYRGEYDAVQKYVPTITAAAVEQKALAMGLADSTGALDAQDKALATEAILLQGAGDAMGDFDRTAGSAANSQRILSAKWKDAQAALGKGLLPIVTRVTQWLADRLPGAVEKVKGAFRNLAAGWKGEGGEGLFGAIGRGARRVYEIFMELKDGFEKGGIGGIFKKLGQMWSNAWPGIQERAKALFEKLGVWLRDTAMPRVGQWLKDRAGEFWAWIQEAYPAYVQRMGELWGRVITWLATEGIPRLGDWLKNTAGPALWEWIRDVWPSVWRALVGLWAAINVWFTTTAIPWMVENGIKLWKALGEWLWTDALPAINRGLNDLITNILGWIQDTGIPWLRTKAGEWFQTLKDKAAEKGTEALVWLQGLPGKISEWITGTALPALRTKASEWFDTLRSEAKSKIDAALKYLRDKVTGFLPDFGSIASRLGGVLSGAMGGVGKAWQKALNVAGGVVSKFLRVGAAVADAAGLGSVGTALRNAANSAEGWAKGGLITGGTPGKDSVHGLLMPGEVVLRKKVVDKIGVRNALALNEGRLPRFASGGLVGAAGSWLADKGKDRIGDLAAGGLSKLWPALGEGRGFSGFGSGTHNKIRQGVLDWVKGEAGKVGSYLASGGPSGNWGKGAAQAAAWVRQAMAITGVPGNWFDRLMSRANQESGFNPRAINLWDSNAKKGVPSKGLFQTIDPTFNAYKLPGMNDIWNPVHNAVAAIRYMIARYGSVFNLPAGGYDKGGFLPTGLSLAYNGTGRPEPVGHNLGQRSGQTIVNIYVEGHVLTEDDLIEVVQSGLVRKQERTSYPILPGVA